MSKIPALAGELFLESVVIHPGLRGRGLGKLLMLKVEEYCVKYLEARAMHLTTHDQQVFYSRCGYTFSEQVCAFGGSCKLIMKMFTTTPKIPPAKVQSSQNGNQATSTESPSTAPVACPPPPPPPCLPPPPPPPPSSTTIVSPPPALLSTCQAALSAPLLADVEAQAAPRLLSLPALAPLDPALAKTKNREEEGAKMCMRKQLV